MKARRTDTGAGKQFGSQPFSFGYRNHCGAVDAARIASLRTSEGASA